MPENGRAVAPRPPPPKEVGQNLGTLGEREMHRRSFASEGTFDASRTRRARKRVRSPVQEPEPRSWASPKGPSNVRNSVLSLQ